MDERFRRVERDFKAGNITAEEYTLRKLNEDLKIGFMPNQGTIMTTPAGVMYFDGVEWLAKSPPPNIPIPIAASGVISFPIDDNTVGMVGSGNLVVGARAWQTLMERHRCMWH